MRSNLQFESRPDPGPDRVVNCSVTGYGVQCCYERIYFRWCINRYHCRVIRRTPSLRRSQEDHLNFRNTC